MRVGLILALVVLAVVVGVIVLRSGREAASRSKGKAPLSVEDREFLQQNFERFGSAWSGGLDTLARDFEVEPDARRKVIFVHLTQKAPPRLRYRIEVKRKDGGMTHEGPDLPDGPELTAEELARVDQVLKREKELWLIEPPNADLRIVDLSKGLAALQGKRRLETRRLERRAMLFMKDPEGWGETLCLWLNLDGGIEGLAWVDLPMDEDQGRWLSNKEVEFIDRAMRDNGDFGVYGNVQEGLRSLMKYMEVRLREDEAKWHVDATPRDGHGHFLHFPIDKKTGEVGQAMAGHLEPMPEDLETPEPEPDELLPEE